MTISSLPLSQIVNVQLNIQPVSSPRRDFSQLVLFTYEITPFKENKLLYLANQQQVEATFGTHSETAKATLPFFAQSPRPTHLMVAPWNKETESPKESLSKLTEYAPHWYAAVFLGVLTDKEILEASEWVLAADKKIFGITTANPDHIEMDAKKSPFKALKDKQNYRVVALYDKSEPYAIMSFLARGLSVNFAANNSTITMKFKQLPGISVESMTLTEANKCKALGVNYYTYFDESAMVAEGTVVGGRFFDEVHILDWFVDAVQKEVFATLYRSATKIPLTDRGTAILIAAVNRVCKEGINNGAFTTGIWHGDAFGNLNTGDRLDEGFYVYCDSVDNLSLSEREQRKSPPIQVAVKLSGAIHSVDIMINFDR